MKFVVKQKILHRPAILRLFPTETESEICANAVILLTMNWRK